MQASWFYHDGTQVRGPFTSQQLVAAARTGRLRRTDRVRQQDSDWTLAENVQGLFPTAPNPVPVVPAQPPATMQWNPAASNPAGSGRQTGAKVPPATTQWNPADSTPVGSARRAEAELPHATMEWSPASDSTGSQDSSGSSGDHNVFDEPEPEATQGSTVHAGATRIVRGLAPGSFLGNYQILETLGQGGMGMVLKAQHIRMERMVALKVLRTQSTKPVGALKRFHQEVKAASKLAHPNIVTAYDADEVNGVHFLVMEYVDGVDLDELMLERKKLPVEDAVGFILQAARGLAYAHEEGVVHRDIKPGNMMLDKRNVIKILDMGLASVKQTAAEAQARPEQVSVHVTEAEQLLGTFDYMAPEQAEDARSADHRADIYSLGCTLFKLITGQTPYRGASSIQKVFAHRDHPIPTMSKIRPEVSFDLDAVFGKMVAKAPDLRYQSMAEVIADLEACLASKPISAWQTGQWGEAKGDGSGILSRDTARRVAAPASADDVDELALSPVVDKKAERSWISKRPPDDKPKVPRWYWKVMGEEIGPLTLEQLRQRNISNLDEVRRDGTDEWTIARDVAGLFE